LLYLLPFLTRLSENLQRVDSRICKYLKTPNAKQIHDIRTSIRRLDTAFQILPKKNRSGSSFSEYVLKCKDLFDVNSEIRDLDIICEKLQKYAPSDQRNGIIRTLKTTRNANLENAKAIARTIKKIQAGKIINKIGVTEKELQKRYYKMILRSVSMIESTFPVVLASDENLKELHDLRISCKKLKYLLELQEDEKKRILKTRKALQKLQDILGAIHDYDFAIKYLVSLELPSLEIQEIIATEKEERAAKFEEFLRFCKRRLGVSPDSFLIALRNLN